MKYLAALLILSIGLCLLSCGEDKPCSCEYDYAAFYASPVGTARVDSMTYYHYWSEVKFKPSVDVSLMTITPNVWYCNGECSFEAYLVNAEGDSISHATATHYSRDLWAYFDPDVELEAGQWYTLNLHIWTTKSVGIRTSGLPSEDRVDDFEVIFARSDTWDDHYVRGSVAFELMGKYK